jgi:hypothetical protein
MHSFVVLIPSYLLLLERIQRGQPESIVRYVVAGIAVAALPLIVLGGYQVVWVLFSWAICGGALLLVGRPEATLKRSM